MGYPKHQIKMADKTWLENSILLLKNLGFDDSQIFLCGQSDSFLGPKVLIDEVKGQGPLRGVYTALQYMYSSNACTKKLSLLVIPIDMPYLNQEVLYELLQKSQEGKKITTFLARPLPAVIPINYELIQYLAKTLQSSDRRDYSLKKFYRKFSAIGIDCSELKVLRNINTISDLILDDQFYIG